MSHRKRKIRNWIIKKLGGYTPQEYDTISRPVIAGNTAVETRGVEHLWIQTIVNQPPFWEDKIIPAEVVQQELVDALLEHIRTRVTFRKLGAISRTLSKQEVYEASIDIVSCRTEED